MNVKDIPNPPGNLTPAMISIKQVAMLLGVNERTIYRRVQAGDMPAPVKIGHLTRWRLKELMAWLDAGCPPVQQPEGGEK